MSAHPDVLIVGGGVIGLTTAYFLGREGVSVEVLDKGEFGAEASWAGAGIISPGNPRHALTAYDRLRATSSALFPELTTQLKSITGIDNGYRKCGGIEFLGDADRETLPAWRTEGVDFEPLVAARIHELEPNLQPLPQKAYLLPGMAQVRNPWHLRALIAACQRPEIRLLPNAPIECFEQRTSRITGVRLANGEVRSAGQYLLAAGAWSDNLLSPLGICSGIHPVRGQIVLLKDAPSSVRRVIMVGKKYLVPREDGHVLVGATEEPEAEFEKKTTAEAIADLIDFAKSLVPKLGTAEVVKCWAGLRPGSLDGLPSLGRVLEFENLFLASGHFRAGIQLSPATALVMSELLTGRPPSIPLDEFRPGRVPGKPFRPAFRS
jgi:glycine oxidase